MAGLISSEARGQFAAIAQVRWQLFVNSLRTMRGRLEMVSRVFIGFGFTMGGLGGAFGVAAASWYFTSHDQTEWLALLLWLIFLFWQLFPVVATAFTETFDSSNLLRFPLSYPVILHGAPRLRLAGSGDGAGRPVAVRDLDGRHGGRPPIVRPGRRWRLLVFALANILLARMVFAWVERWLAQRRTREIMGILFFFLIISFQFIGPLMARFGGKKHPDVSRLSVLLLPLERLLPPGLAASALAAFFAGGLRRRVRVVRASLRLCRRVFLVFERAHARAVSRRKSKRSGRRGGSAQACKAWVQREAGGARRMERARGFGARRRHFREGVSLSLAQRPDALHADHAARHPFDLSSLARKVRSGRRRFLRSRARLRVSRWAPPTRC